MAKKEAKPVTNKSSSTNNAKTAAALSYILIGVIWYFVDEAVRKDAYAKFHVKQAINLMLFSIAASVALSILMVTIILIPIVMLLGPVVQLVTLVLCVLGIINAAQDKQKELPIIGQYAEKYLSF